jgi:hypothetical protein
VVPRRPAGLALFPVRRQLAAQDTVGQVVLPLVWIVTPKLLPLPFGLAVITWALG